MADESGARRVDHHSRRDLHDRFLAINRDRVRRGRECLTPRQCEFFDLLPLLVHTNHPTLPGYVTQATPAGIFDYQPSAGALNVAHKLARSFAWKRALFKYEIDGLYVMGSAGSIGFSQGSDFDIWLCHVPGIAPERVAELVGKARLIETFAAERGLDVHFFVFDAPTFRAGRTQSLSTQSSGSTQHYLLLDEFYRSGLVLCGRSPLWWLVPPEHEKDYDDYVADLTRRRLIRTEDYIDFGGIPQVPAEEFFGATVWQLYKSIDSPYKSVLKLLLTEVYADEYPHIELLSLRYKRAVYEGVTSHIDLDPYALMYRKTEEYLMARGDSARLDLLRRCFYIKVDERLSMPPAGPASDWRRDIVSKLVFRWGWDQDRIALIDRRENWRLETVLAERRDIVNTLSQSYRFLSRFARDQAGNPRITQRDLTVLGRKLYAAFERKAGKIEQFNRGIGADVGEKRLSLQESGTDAEAGWMLCRDPAGTGVHGDGAVLKRSRSVTEVLTWCHLNRIMRSDTTVTLSTRTGTLEAREIRQIGSVLAATLGARALADPTAQELTHTPRIRAASLFVNVGIDPMRTNLKGGEHLATSRSDALSYGGLRRNLAHDFQLVLVTSWAEVFVFQYHGADGLMSCAAELLRWALAAGQPPPLTVHCFNPGYGSAIAARIETLVTDVLQHFLATRSRIGRRYLIEIDRRYHLLEVEETGPRHSVCETWNELRKALQSPTAAFRRLKIAAGSLEDSPLPQLYEINRRDCVQVVLSETAQGTDVYVLDERGALNAQRLPAPALDLAVDQLARFFGCAFERLDVMRAGTAGAPALTVEYYRACRSAGHWRLERIEPPREQRGGYFEVQVIGDVDAAGQTTFTIFCDAIELSSLEHGAGVFDAAARHILARRASGEHYPLYITDLDLSAALLARRGIESLQTVHLLQYKHTIEGYLNKASAQS
ncbi:MAG: class I adenylate cyclase [Gammaproteobacteria bacterium]|nr:class I adenylate cyclase [Gammaproteobacteria bacterium]